MQVFETAGEEFRPDLDDAVEVADVKRTLLAKSDLEVAWLGRPKPGLLWACNRLSNDVWEYLTQLALPLGFVAVPGRRGAPTTNRLPMPLTAWALTIG